MAARAEFVEDKREFDRICDLFLTRNPEYTSWGRPSPAMSPLVRLVPEWISAVDYSKSFGHSDLVRVSKQDLQSGTGDNDRSAGATIARPRVKFALHE